MARNLTTDVGERVGAIEGEVGEVRRRVEGTAENVARTDNIQYIMTVLINSMYYRPTCL